MDLVGILVRQLCNMDDHGNGLAEDAQYDFVNNPNASLSEKQNALALIERKINLLATVEALKMDEKIEYQTWVKTIVRDG